MVVSSAPTARVRAWGQVAAAIALVAQGRYPRVVVTAVEDARQLVGALGPDAERCGVELVVEPCADDARADVVAQAR